jgi:hypothetical protein
VKGRPKRLNIVIFEVIITENKKGGPETVTIVTVSGPPFYFLVRELQKWQF